jgi:hypothetical protein
MTTSIPTTGDVIVRKSDDASTPSMYSLSIYEGRPQFLVETNKRACDLARPFARQTHVDLWNNNDGQFSCVSRFRFR